MKKTTHARSTAVVIRVHPEERDLLKLNAGVHGLSVSDYVRKTCLRLRLRRTPEERRRLRELARIGSNLNGSPSKKGAKDKKKGIPRV